MLKTLLNKTIYISNWSIANDCQFWKWLGNGQICEWQYITDGNIPGFAQITPTCKITGPSTAISNGSSYQYTFKITPDEHIQNQNIDDQSDLIWWMWNNNRVQWQAIDYATAKKATWASIDKNGVLTIDEGASGSLQITCIVPEQSIYKQCYGFLRLTVTAPTA